MIFAGCPGHRKTSTRARFDGVPRSPQENLQPSNQFAVGSSIHSTYHTNGIKRYFTVPRYFS